MRRIQFLLYIVIIPFVYGCHGDEDNGIISWTQDASALIENGVLCDYKQTKIALKFTTTNSDVSVSSNESWVDTSISLVDGNGELNICVLENFDISSRHGTVMVHSQNGTTIIHIKQEGVPNVVPENDVYYHSYMNGEIKVKVQAGSPPTVTIFPKGASWISISEVAVAGKNEYVISLSLNKNEGVGRIASLDFKINGHPADISCKPCIIQEPAPFEESVEISTDKPGCLQILLGNNVSNIDRIRFLKIIGPINCLDFPIIKSFFSMDEDNCTRRSVSIDLSQCAIVAGNRNPYEYYGWDPTTEGQGVHMSGEIPSNVFTNAVNLKEIILPESLKIIGSSAFSGCKSLKMIQIPNSVEEISSKAFYGCTGLEEVQIDTDSNLSYIGNQAFTTGSTLKTLTIPTTAINISSEAFLGCSVSSLHLKWPEPLEIRIVPKADECTLFVPRGTGELYRNTKNWCNFKDIIEE